MRHTRPRRHFVGGGVLSEDGIGGLELGELGEGRAFSALQLYLRELRRRGILLAVCSKTTKTQRARLSAPIRT